MKILQTAAFLFCFIGIAPAQAQFIDSSGYTPYIRQYVEENEDNWNKSIIYVFYNNTPCAHCAEAMGEIYNIYQQNYSNDFSYFEIDYQEEGENAFTDAYFLNQALSIVLVRINNGMSRGYYKIDNPQQWWGNELFFKEQITTAINNFLLN